jgi:RNA polymerase sigma-70 factor, ECF subfamily
MQFVAACALVLMAERISGGTNEIRFNADLSQTRHAFAECCSLGSPPVMEVEQLNALMRQYGSGDDGAFDPLYQLLAPRLYRFCLRLTALRSDADDLFQETFLRLHRGRATYLAGANVLHWTFAIARSASLDRLRYRRRRPEFVGVTGDVADAEELHAHESHRPDLELLAEDLIRVVTVELRKMSEKNRVAYVLLREEGLSVKEAALVLGTTADVVKQRVHRACEQLRSAVGAAGWEEYSLGKLLYPIRA